MWLLNLYTPGIFDAHGCTDPLIRGTISAVKVNTTFQWQWIALNCIILGLIIWTMESMNRRSLKGRASRLNRWLVHLVTDPHSKVVSQWCENVRSSKLCGTTSLRTFLFWLLHFPFLFLASVPAIGYVSFTDLCVVVPFYTPMQVLARNVPSESGWWYVLAFYRVELQHELTLK